jgi:protein N-terminal methyltransferase
MKFLNENELLNNYLKSFVNKATEYLGPDDAKRVLKFHCCGLQSFYPEQKKYDIVWIQWVLGYLKDNDAIDFLKRCKASLKPNGMCILKENVCVGEPELDEIDASYTRPRKSYLNLIHKAEMFVIRDEKQRKFPAELYEVRLFAFK